MTAIDLTPTQDTILLHFASSLKSLDDTTISGDVLAYIVAGTNKRPMDIAKTLKFLYQKKLIDATVGPEANGKTDILWLTDEGRAYLKEQGWSLDEDTKKKRTEKGSTKKSRKSRADKAPAGLPSDADPETLKSNREAMAKTPRSSGSHANCEHEATKAARSKCRKARAAAA